MNRLLPVYHVSFMNTYKSYKITISKLNIENLKVLTIFQAQIIGISTDRISEKTCLSI